VGEREGEEWVVREGVGAWGRNDPSIVYTYEIIKEKGKKNKTWLQ
jgi:hypothetical protein